MLKVCGETAVNNDGGPAMLRRGLLSGGIGRGLPLLCLLFFLLASCTGADKQTEVAAQNNLSAFEIPDTGQTKCYSSSGAEIPCEGSGQDGAYTISPMTYTDNGNATVTDNNTGLMWQQTDDGNIYNWYEASGTYNETYNPKTTDACGSLKVGGYSDWHLPTKKELISIIDFSIPNPGPTISSVYFPNAHASGHWAFTSYVHSSDYAWYVDFHDGSVNGNDCYEGYVTYVRCVRGGQSLQSLIDNGNGTVTDRHTGLIWQQGEAGLMTWDSALSYCEGTTLAGSSDWRLPNNKELESLTNDTGYDIEIDKTFFPDAYASDYWSSTTRSQYPAYAWGVNFGFGYIIGFNDNKTYSKYVRCVYRGSGPREEK